MVRASDFVLSWRDIDLNDKHHVGEHAAKLATLSTKFLVPAGFVVLPNAYFHFLNQAYLKTKISHLIGSINFDRDDSIQQVAKHIKHLIIYSDIPSEISAKVIDEYEKIGSPIVTLQTSIVSGDNTQSSFHDYLVDDILGDAALLNTLRILWADIYSTKLLKHREKNGIYHTKTGITATVKKKIKSQLKGKISTNDPHSQDKGKVIITIQNHPFEYLVDKNSQLITKRKSLSEVPAIYIKEGLPLNSPLTDTDIATLARYGLELEQMHYFPQCVDFALENGNFYFTDLNPLSTYAKN